MFFVSCEKDKQDTSKPFVNILNPEPSELLHLYSGEDLKIELLFKDNKALSQYKLAVKNEFENAILPDVYNSPAKAFSVIYVTNIDGKESSQEVSLKTEVNAISGKYSLTVNCVDASGNQAEPVILNFLITSKIDSVAPEINVVTPVAGAQYASDSTVVVNALFEDKRNDASAGFIYDYSVQILKVTDESEVFSISQKMDKKSPQSFSQSLPAFSESGDYILKITARDDFNNLSEITRVFRVL
jgi:hypothetical protein